MHDVQKINGNKSGTNVNNPAPENTPGFQIKPENTTSHTIIQPRLTVGAPDDPYEKEADAVAGRVMRMTGPDFIRRKCTACEEEEKIHRQAEEDELPVQAKHQTGYSFIQKKCSGCETEEMEKVQRQPVADTITPFIQAKSNGETTVSEGLSSSIRNSRGSGSAMDVPTQSFMESRFGADFSPVKIHTGSEAVQMNKELNAQAFTVGHDIYFNENKYQPASTEGKQLLAHELTHVVQQGKSNSSPVQRRRDPSFEIADLYEDRANEPGFVFFEIAQPDAATTNLADSIDPDEKKKIKDKAAADPPHIHLFGFSSEEGAARENNDLITRRLTAVKDSLIAEGYDAARISTSNQRTLSRSHYDYRFWRTVEMSDSATSSRQQSGGSTSRGIGPCTTDQRDEADKARQDAVTITNKIIDRLNAYVSNPNADQDLKNALQFYFRNDSTTFVRNRLIRRYRRILGFLNRMMRILKCGTPLSQDCGGSDALTGPSEIILCNGFYTGGYTTRQQAYLLIHESGHGSSEAIGDRGYQWERVFLFLSTEQALANADSFSTMAEELIEGCRPSGVVSPTLDDTTGCDSNPTLRDHIREAVAWSQRLNTYAVSGIQQTYGSDANTQFMSPFFIAHFGRADRTAMAGILDRYLKMADVFNQSLTFNCPDTTDPVCAASTLPVWTIDGEVTVCPQQLNQATQRQRTDQMYAGLAAIMPGVTDSQRLGYPRLARNYKNEFWEERG